MRSTNLAEDTDKCSILPTALTSLAKLLNLDRLVHYKPRKGQNDRRLQVAVHHNLHFLSLGPQPGDKFNLHFSSLTYISVTSAKF